VFEGKEWAALIGRSILPKLAYTLAAEFAVNPVAQDLTAWQWVMSWAGVLPRAQLISLLEDHFFPQWHAVLQHWLAHNPDYDEVTAWYLGWKVLLRAHPTRHNPKCMITHDTACLSTPCKRCLLHTSQPHLFGGILPGLFVSVSQLVLLGIAQKQTSRAEKSSLGDTVLCEVWRGTDAVRCALAGHAAGRGAGPRANPRAPQLCPQRHEQRGGGHPPAVLAAGISRRRRSRLRLRRGRR
jgi:hypothetical protein